MAETPTLYVIAGPNGAGKTTFFEKVLEPKLPGVEFVNADRLAQQQLGHAAVTLEQSQLGQRLADERRTLLMQQRKSLVTESTFSHESKLQLVRSAIASGYRVELFHLNVRSASIAVKRVQARVERGGHPVPEDKTRERYQRNQPLIRAAAKLADIARVYDNSNLGKRPRQVIVLERGVATKVQSPVPAWARDLYANELEQYSAARVNRPAASFVEAKTIVTKVLSDKATTYVARRDGHYSGLVIGETDLHVLQQIGRAAAVAHFRSALNRQLTVGENVTVLYDDQGKSAVVSRYRTSKQIAHDQAKARAFSREDRSTVLKRYPELRSAYAVLDAAAKKVGTETPDLAERVVDVLRSKLASGIERGETVADQPIKQRERKPKERSR